MKNLVFTFLAIIVLSCSNSPEVAQLDMVINGMSCAHSCAPHIQEKLSETEGVLEATVDFETKSAKIKLDKGVISKEDVVEKIEELVNGAYEVESCKETVLSLEKSNPKTDQESSSKFDITKPDVSTSGFKLPNIFKLLNSLLK